MIGAFRKGPGQKELHIRTTSTADRKIAIALPEPTQSFAEKSGQ